jgi:hypothetical protein
MHLIEGSGHETEAGKVGVRLVGINVGRQRRARGNAIAAAWESRKDDMMSPDAHLGNRCDH